MTEAEQIMKRCQAGTRNYEEANNLHAACYGIIGKLLAQQEKDYERGFVDGMQKQMQSSVDKAVNRMAQPEQECPNLKNCNGACFQCEYFNVETGEMEYPVAQPEQEPVAWRTFDGEGGYDYRSYEDNESYADDWNKRNPKHVGWVDELYTYSQRTWVGLTDEEMEVLFQTAAGADEEVHIRFARAIESKIKELNT